MSMLHFPFPNKKDPVISELNDAIHDHTKREAKRAEETLYATIRKGFVTLCDDFKDSDHPVKQVVCNALRETVTMSERSCLGNMQYPDFDDKTVSRALEHLRDRGVELTIDVIHFEHVRIHIRGVTKTFRVENVRERPLDVYTGLPGSLGEFDTLDTDGYVTRVTQNFRDAVETELLDTASLLFYALLAADHLDPDTDAYSAFKTAVLAEREETLSGRQHIDRIVRVARDHDLHLDLRFREMHVRADDDTKPHGGMHGTLFLWERIHSADVTGTPKKKTT